jgi:hypothetical protein
MVSTCILSVATVIACGGEGGQGPQQQAPTFSGTYATQVTLTSNSCGTITVQNNPTGVNHDQASGAVTFTHAGITYTGTVRQDSTFTTPARDVNVGDGFNYSIGLSGRFNANAFEADATIDRTSATTPVCRFTVHWAGSK